MEIVDSRETPSPFSSRVIDPNYVSSLLKAVAQVALGSVQGYHGLVLASGLYGASLGGALYSLKMLALERLRARHFARSWALVQAAEALPILFGVPLTGMQKLPDQFPKRRTLNSPYLLENR